MEPTSSLMNSKEYAKCHYLEPDQSSPSPPIPLLEDPSYSRSSKWSLSFRFPHQNPVCTSPLLHMCHITCPSHTSLFDHSSNIWWRILFMKLFTMLSSSFPCYLVPLRPKYLPQCAIIRCPQPITYEMAICHNPHNFSNWDFRITRQLRYKHTFSQNVVSTKHWTSVYFCKNVTCLNVGLLKTGKVFFVSCKTGYLWVMTNCFFRSVTFLPRSERPSFTYI